MRKCREAPHHASIARRSAAESRAYVPSGVFALNSGIAPPSESMEMPIVRAVPRMTAIASSACGAQIALTSIANRPQAYPAPLSRQLADDQQAESRGANETRFVAMGLATYAAVILETRASSRRSRAARDSPLS